MLAGFCEKDFTPAEGNRPGEIGPYYAKGARTPLMAHAAVITSGDQTQVFISMDIIFITVELSQRIKREIAAALSIPTENILLACTHTHGVRYRLSVLGHSRRAGGRSARRRYGSSGSCRGI